MSAVRRGPGAERGRPAMGPEQLLAFGDAVFAIAITLLILDVGVPDGLAASDIGDALRDALPDVGAYVLSFAVIGMLWLAQHALFTAIAWLDAWLLYLYLALLAVIAGLPFPTRLISEYGDTAPATMIYAGAIAAASSLMTAMSLRLVHRPALVKPGIPRESLTRSVQQGLVVVVVFAASMPLTLASPVLAQLSWLVAVPLRIRLSRRSDTGPSPA
ncbi:putative membrane protein [Streptomyces sp. V4I23]|uniref:TMEM175 family protein n=1 Tax=Streptomyces sp. V4I23 TaxID=3042282 RepID=UPI00277D84E2|nr:TMEM175 family protein [Streptomyces sp. V4I23]MDQ1006110.1 putative membrane protein [Streptomyces sp. V4I23]